MSLKDKKKCTETLFAARNLSKIKIQPAVNQPVKLKH